MSSDRISAEVLKDYARQIMCAYGVDEAQVQSVSENMIWSELVGRSNFGVQRLPIHMKRVARGVLSSSCHPKFQRLSDSVELLDGDGGFGQHVGEIGMRRAIELAREYGSGIVGVFNSNFFGAGAYFVHKAAEAGMIGLAMSNSYPKVTAYGGLKPVLGTNPFAFGAPRRNGQSLMLDMATSALAGSSVREHISKRKPLPVGLAIDADGNPITDPKMVGDGALLPFGGAKGYGLALLVEMLAGVITGASMSHGVASMYHNFTESGHNGHFLMALDISRWMSLETYHERFESLIEIIKSSNPGQQVLLPGEIRWQHYEDNLVNGIHLEHKVRRLLLELSQPHDIMPPWD